MKGLFQGDFSPEERFWMKVDKKGDDECWLWKDGVDKDGYGILGISGKPVKAHRFSWELHYGATPDNMGVRHLCTNRKCCNPKHFYLQDEGKIRDESRSNPGHNARKGEEHPFSVLTNAQVREIKEMLSQDIKQVAIAKRFSVSEQVISDIKRGKRWKSI